MSRYVKISAVGSENPSVDLLSKKNSVVEQIIEYWSSKIDQVLPDEPDIIVLPELCDLVSNDIPIEDKFEFMELGKKMLLDFYSSKAKDNNCYLVYPTLTVHQDNSLRNSICLFNRQGQAEVVYDKNYPTLSEIEDYGISPGTEPILAETEFGSVGFAICFDLNFDQMKDKYANLNPDLMIFPSMFHGGLLQSSWAYACRSFFVSAISNIPLPSQIRNPQGNVIASTTNYTDFVTARVNFDYQLVHLDKNCEKLTRLKKKYKTDVTISDPGFLGSVIVYSENNSLTAEQLTGEFQIELLDSYLSRSLSHQLKEKE